MSLEFLLIIVAIICLLLATLNVVLFVKLKIRGRDTEALKTLHIEQLKTATYEAEKKLKDIDERFAAVLDIEKEIDNAANEALRLERQIQGLRDDYAAKRMVFDDLSEEVAIYDERISFAKLGVYEPHFEFSDSETFKEAIRTVRNQQKALIKEKVAVVCKASWEIDNSLAKGKTFSSRNIRLTLKAFNNECEAAIANTRWNNATAMIKRIENACTQIDKLNETNKTKITPDFERMKLEELRLTHEYRKKLKEEQAERSEITRLAREEKRLLQAAAEAKREEEKYEQLLAKARTELDGVDTEKQDAKIEELERQLAISRQKTERAQTMAEKTKSGFVYIISNLGSFGEGIVKIGLTRRLDPLDRVKELGDASVPFLFDTHAMIYSDEAPALESALHNAFSNSRVNAANMRKEFFRATLEEVEAAVQRLAPDAEFFKDVEAQEFKETLAKRKFTVESDAEAQSRIFPNSI